MTKARMTVRQQLLPYTSHSILMDDGGSLRVTFLYAQDWARCGSIGGLLSNYEKYSGLHDNLMNAIRLS